MSPRVVTDPEALENFARTLRAFNNHLKSQRNNLNAQFRQLGEVWRDQEHRKFAEQFQQTMKLLSQFEQISEGQIPLLRRKAEKLREYLNQR